MHTSLVLVCCFWCCYGQTIINAVPGVYSSKHQSDGLTLPATSGTFQPIGELTSNVSMSSSWDYQTAVINVMWFEYSYEVSDNIKCYPSPTTLNDYDNYGPMNDLEAIIQLPSKCVVNGAYQVSV